VLIGVITLTARPGIPATTLYELTSNNYYNLLALRLYMCRPIYLLYYVLLYREPIHTHTARCVCVRYYHPVLRYRGIKRYCDPSVRPSVCLSVPFCDYSRSLDMRTSPFHTHSIGGSMVDYACVQRGHIASPRDTCL